MKISTLFPPPIPDSPITVTVPRWDVKRSIYRLLATIIFAIIINIIVFIPTYAQLQQSGGAGSSVTITGSLPTGSNVIGHVIADSGSTTAVTQATGTNLHTVVDSGTITTVTTLTGITNALPAGTNVIGYVRTAPLTSCGTTILDSGLIVVPATTTAITGMGSAATCMDKIYLNNTLGTSAVCNITDVTGPTSYVKDFSIPGNSNLLLLFGGIKYAGGAKWFCATGTVNGQALGYQ